MVNLILFSRCELVELYGQIHADLRDTFNVTHIAYSQVEKSILDKKYSIDSVVLMDSVKDLLAEEVLDLELCFEMDALLRKTSNGRFNLASAIQSDRSFANMSFDQARILAQVYYKFWRSALSDLTRPNVIHEPTSLFLNQICSAICADLEGGYYSPIMSYGPHKFSFIFVKGDGAEFTFNGKDASKPESVEKAKMFLETFRSDYDTFAGAHVKTQGSIKAFLTDLVKFTGKWTYLNAKAIGKHYALHQHLEQFHEQPPKLLQGISRLLFQFDHSIFDEVKSEDKYYYYPMHLEPEAVVLYWGDGLYTGQVKLIENIARQLPADTYLVVKDHPHGGAYRDPDDYRRIAAIPNVKLVHTSQPGKSLIANSLGVVTINGTSGFEALLLRKSVYCFGNAFYSTFPGVHKITDVQELSLLLSEPQENKIVGESELLETLSKYLCSTYDGFISYFGNNVQRYGVNESENKKVVAESLIRFFSLNE